MGGGDVEGLLEDAEGGLPLPQALEIAIATARGLEFAHAQGRRAPRPKARQRLADLRRRREDR